MQRLVIIIIFKIIPSIVFCQQNPCSGNGASYSSMSGDTTIILPSGTMLTFNRCEFFDIRDCITIKEIKDTSDLRREGLTMFQEGSRNVLLSCGMINIDFKGCGKTCLDVPVKIQMPVRFQNCVDMPDEVPSLFFSVGDQWSMQTQIKTSYVKINTQNYLEFLIKCGAKINCDIPKRPAKIKLIAPRGYKISKAVLSTNCPLYYKEYNASKPQRKIKVWVPCLSPEFSKIKVDIVDVNNEKMSLEPVTLSTLKHNHKRIKCGRGKGLLGFLKPKRGASYKRYFLNPPVLH